jgi:Fe-S-cluster containining protein
MAANETLRSLLIQHTCARKCMGLVDNEGGCCTLADRDFILGPVDDVDELLERLGKYWGRPVLRIEVLIDCEEGRELFPGRSTWQNPRNYPALRVRPDNPRFPCMFYDEAGAGCSIYEDRPHMCQKFTCDWLKHVLEVL